jgi:hypothetical protein
MTRKHGLTLIIEDAKTELHEIEMEERTIECAKLFGRCYKYRNSYSCPQTEADYFHLYMLVTGNEDGGIRQFTFQTDCQGKVEIRDNEWHTGLLGGYVEIPRREFDREWKKVLTRLGKVRFPKSPKKTP